jgi:hypothetical protein
MVFNTRYYIAINNNSFIDMGELLKYAKKE